jgi:rhamnose transport system substrate-binding protein
MKHIVFTALAVMLISASFFGCRRNNSRSPEAAGGDAANPNSGIIKIYFIPKNMGNPYFDALSSGFYNAITQLGEENFEYTYTGPDTAEAGSQIPYVEEAIRRGIDAVFIAANSDTALNDVFDRARGEGIRIYVINQDITGGEDHRDAAIMPVNFDTVGESLMSAMGEQLNYQGQFAILSATEDAPDQNAWIRLMREEMRAKSVYSRMELAATVYGDDQYERSAALTEELLSRYPDLKGIIAPTAAGLPAVCEVVRNRGLSGTVKITGLGLPSQMAEYIDDGTCENFQLWNPPYEGIIAVYLVWAEKKAGFVPAPGAVFSVPRLGEYTILPNGQILALEKPMLYDKSNIGEYSILF